MSLRVACIIDLGSNAIRFLVACPDQHGRSKVLHRDRNPIRLGSAVFATGRVGDEALQIIDAIQHFQEYGFKIESEFRNAEPQWLAVATSALREAGDRDQVIQKVREATQIEIEILSGEEEAKLALQSVTAVQPLNGPFVVADLGGGSLELTLGQDGCMLRSSSFQLGAVRWQHAIDSDTPEALTHIHHEQERLRAFIGNHKALTCIGLGGAFRTMHQITGESSFKASTLEQWRNKLAPLLPTERSQKHGLPKDRADIILPAIDALCLTLDAVQGTSWNVLDGVGGIADALAQQLLQEQRDPADECKPD